MRQKTICWLHTFSKKLPIEERTAVYDAFLRDIETYFEPVRLLKRGARGTVTLLRHRETGKRYIFRRFTGSA